MHVNSIMFHNNDKLKRIIMMSIIISKDNNFFNV